MTSFFDEAATTPIPLPPRTGAQPVSRPPRHIRICLMVAGHFSSDQNDMYNAFLAWLQKSLPQYTNVTFQLDPYEAQDNKYPSKDEIENYDAVLISGSPADAFGDDPWILRLMMFIQTLATKHQRIRIYGVCFGSQIVARALGGTVERNGGRWEIGVTEVETTYMGKLLFGIEDMELLQFHQDHVILNSLSDYLAPGELYLLGSTRRTSVQGIVKFYDYHEQNDGPSSELVNRVHIMTTQGHPEFTPELATEILRRRHEKGEVSDQGFEEFFGSKGNLSDTPPVLKKDTGKRWLDYSDGIRIVGTTFWRMLGVDYGHHHPPRVPT